jgi:hypothetical protein
MAIDKGLEGDTQTYMTKGDPSWLSPDLQLVSAVNSNTVVNSIAPGKDGFVRLIYRRKTTGSYPSGAGAIKIEAWICIPAIVMAPDDLSQTRRITTPPSGAVISPLPAAGSQTSYWVQFHPSTDASKPDGPGHKCLVARCYAVPGSMPAADNLANYLSQDPHYAQHNITIAVGAGAGLRAEGHSEDDNDGIWLSTVNPNPKEAAAVTIRAVADVQPNKHVRDIVLSHVRQIEGFKRIASAGPPGGFRVHLPHFVKIKAIDRSSRIPVERPATAVQKATTKTLTARTKEDAAKLASLAFAARTPAFPSYDAKVTLEPGRATRVRFQGDFSKAKRGDAHIFHIIQLGPGNIIQGGMTYVRVIT